MGVDQQEGTLKLCGKGCVLYPAGVCFCSDPVIQICNEADQLYVLRKRECNI